MPCRQQGDPMPATTQLPRSLEIFATCRAPAALLLRLRLSFAQGSPARTTGFQDCARGDGRLGGRPPCALGAHAPAISTGRSPRGGAFRPPLLTAVGGR